MISPFDICFKLSKQKKTTMFPIDTPFLVDVPREKKQSLTEKIHTVANGNNLGYKPHGNVMKTWVTLW